MRQRWSGEEGRRRGDGSEKWGKEEQMKERGGLRKVDRTSKRGGRVEKRRKRRVKSEEEERSEGEKSGEENGGK